MTLLSICQDAADEIGILRPTAVAASTDPNVQKLFRMADKVGNRLMKVVAWQDLRKEQNFTSAAAVTQTLATWKPSDFDRFVPETFWDRDNNYLISGPVTAKEWQTQRGSNYSGARKFAFRGGDMHIWPILAGGQEMAFEYVSSHWAQDNSSTGQTRFEADTDTAVLDEELITLGVVYEFLTSEGLPNGAAASAYEERFELMVENDQPDAGIMVAGDIFGVGRHFDGVPGQSSDHLSGDSSSPTWENDGGVW